MSMQQAEHGLYKSPFVPRELAPQHWSLPGPPPVSIVGTAGHTSLGSGSSTPLSSSVRIVSRGGSAELDHLDNMSRSSRRGPWLPEEDRTLLNLVHSQGPNNWVRISQHMQHRTPKQCRERYHQNLKPSLNHEPITAQEGEQIEEYVQELGKRWAEIARRLGNRSDNAVKNWWNGSMNRRKRTTISHGTGSRSVGPRVQPMPLSPPSHLHLQQQQRHHANFSMPPLFTRNDSGSSNLSVRDYGFKPTFPHDQHQPRIVDQDRGLFNRRIETTGFQSLYHSHVNSLSSPASKDLPPLQTIPSFRSELQLPPLNCPVATAPSPVATELSRTSSRQDAPSLVSDDQSNYSISPKTITSPRPGPAPGKAPSLELWAQLQRRNSTGNHQGYDAHFGQEGYYEHCNPGSFEPIRHIAPLKVASPHTRPTSLPDPSDQRGIQSTGIMISSSHNSSQSLIPKKDLRMNVSSLVH